MTRLIAISLLLAGCTVPYRAVPPPQATPQEVRRVDTYCQRYEDPENCYRAAGWAIEPMRKEVARVNWQTTF